MRATFFSSVAHELRTPLNSISPIIKLVLGILNEGDSSQSSRTIRLLNIVLNSSIHLQNVIEDALDISRIEKNKFTIFYENFNIRDTVQEVSDVMKFQIDSKALAFFILIDESVA